MNVNYYRGVEDQPYHLSVGAVLVNDQHQVACHFFKEIMGLRNIYILMRETLEPGESIDEALERGLMEEFGATARIRTYVGSLIVPVKDPKQDFEKTTLYFVCDLIGMDISRRSQEDEERNSEVKWMSIDELGPLMRAQGKHYQMADLDESEVLERVRTLL